MDAASGIGFPLAFSAGLISFLSPCVLPLVPGYLSAIAGGHPDEVRTGRVIGPLSRRGTRRLCLHDRSCVVAERATPA